MRIDDKSLIIEEEDSNDTQTESQQSGCQSDEIRSEWCILQRAENSVDECPPSPELTARAKFFAIPLVSQLLAEYSFGKHRTYTEECFPSIWMLTSVPGSAINTFID
ncbi:hypothetical protein Tcan_18067 [Toxocara canis]|uniref:Uncharacterized protein n=1 Tax=Toxocara canis TaxID=6265 RepID=A0A0B2V7E9_TOXCA|nr:hypothetical protein Tcan_18067 [Toxocara canis]